MIMQYHSNFLLTMNKIRGILLNGLFVKFSIFSVFIKSTG